MESCDSASALYIRGVGAGSCRRRRRGPKPHDYCAVPYCNNNLGPYWYLKSIVHVPTLPLQIGPKTDGYLTLNQILLSTASLYQPSSSLRSSNRRGTAFDFKLP